MLKRILSTLLLLAIGCSLHNNDVEEEYLQETPVNQNNSELVRPEKELLSRESTSAISLDRAKAALATLASTDLGWQMIEFNCIYRAEASYGILIEAGIPLDALLRVTTAAPQMNDLHLKQFLEAQKNNATFPKGSFTVPDSFMKENLKKLEKYFPTVGSKPTVITYEDQFFTFYSDKTMTIAGIDLTLRPDDHVHWAVGHITAGVNVIDKNGNEQIYALDPAFDSEKLLTLNQWRAAQGNPDSFVLIGAVENEAPPSLAFSTLTDAQYQKISGILHGMDIIDDSELDRKDAIREIISDLDQIQKEVFYNKLFGTSKHDALSYQNWAGFSFGGKFTNSDQVPFPNHPSKERMDEALKKLIPFVKLQEWIATLQ